MPAIIFIYIKWVLVINRGLQIYWHCSIIFGNCCRCEVLELMVLFTQSSPEAAGGSLLVTVDSADSTTTKALTLLPTCLCYCHCCWLLEAGTV